MYRSLLWVGLALSYAGQALAAGPAANGSAAREYEVRIVEVALADDGPREMEEIARNFRDDVIDSRGEIVQTLLLTAVDGHPTRFVQSKKFDLLEPMPSPLGGQSLSERQYWLGFAVELSVKKMADSARLSLKYNHAFVPEWSPDSKVSDVVALGVEKTIDLKEAAPVAIELVPTDQESDPQGGKRYLIVSVSPDDA